MYVCVCGCVCVCVWVHIDWKALKCEHSRLVQRLKD